MSWLPPRTALLAILFALIMSCGGALAAAQPAPGDCSLEPLTLPLFNATPAAQIAATPVADGPKQDVDEAFIEDAVAVIVACMNTGDAAYQYAIFTERYLAEQLADPTVTNQAAFERRLSLGPSGDPGLFALVGVADVEALDGGRVSVVVELDAGRTTYRDTLILANVDGAWLIDEVRELDSPR